MFGSDFKMSPNSFHVTFRAKANADFGLAREYTLRRAAEITLNSGFKYFEIVSIKDDFQKMPADQWSVSYSLPFTNITIECFLEKPEKGDVIDADYFLKNNSLKK